MARATAWTCGLRRSSGPRLQPDDARRPAETFSAGGRCASRSPAAPRPPEPAAARRADQPPGSRGAQLARRVSRRLPVRGHPRLARPVFLDSVVTASPTSLRRLTITPAITAVRRAARRHAGALRRRRRSRTRNGASRCSSIGSATRPPRRAGAEPHQAAREGGAESRCRPSGSDSLHVSGVPEERPHGARAEARAQGVRSVTVFRISRCTSSAAIASRSSVPTGRASRR